MSFLWATFRLGLSNLRLHKLRTFLTSLGIILGVAAVIVMVAIGEGNKQAALRDIQALGATNIIVRSTRPPEASNTGSEQRSFMARYGILRQDLRRLTSAMTHTAAVVPLKAIGSEITFSSQRMTSQAFGVTPELQEVANVRVDPRGRYITAADLEQRAPVAIIGSEVAKKFFRFHDPLESDFRIDQRVFRVVGVMEPVGLAGGKGSALVGRDLNFDVHIPITTAELAFGDLIMRGTSGSFQNEQVELSEVYVTSQSTQEVMRDAEMVRRVMEVGHPRLADVQIVVPWELLESAKRTAMVWNIVLTAIAGISLLVGGIGIMNIMLASVTERTREIGIRRAMGATRRHIVWQFLVETGSLTAVGGVVGILMGVSICLGLGVLSEHNVLESWFNTSVKLETDITPWSIVVSFLVASTVGIVFGIYPAMLASRQDPVVALRHD